MWEGNVKIKSSVIIKKYSEGGLQMMKKIYFHYDNNNKQVKKNNFRFSFITIPLSKTKTNLLMFNGVLSSVLTIL